MQPQASAKSAINEFFWRKNGSDAEFPHYQLKRVGGSDHAPLFTATVTHPSWAGRAYVSEHPFARARDAELSAATVALRDEPTFAAPASSPARHRNPRPAEARRAVLIDLENQQGALAFEPHVDDWVMGFLHRGGAHAVNAAACRFPVEIVEAVGAGADAADVALLWRLAALVVGESPLSERAPIFVVSADHLFTTAAVVLAEGGRARGHAVEACSWADFLRLQVGGRSLLAPQTQNV